jgi:hypothetical protein
MTTTDFIYGFDEFVTTTDFKLQIYGFDEFITTSDFKLQIYKFTDLTDLRIISNAHLLTSPTLTHKAGRHCEEARRSNL